jgi:hypothetical protein
MSTAPLKLLLFQLQLVELILLLHPHRAVPYLRLPQRAADFRHHHHHPQQAADLHHHLLRQQSADLRLRLRPQQAADLHHLLLPQRTELRRHLQ